LPIALEDAADRLGLQLNRVERLARERVAHRGDRLVHRSERHFNQLTGKIVIRVSEAVQKELELPGFGVVAEFAARGDFPAGNHRMVIEPGQALEEAELLQALACVDGQRVRVDARGDVPALAREARNHLGLERLVVNVKEVEDWRRREQEQSEPAEQRDLDYPSKRHLANDIWINREAGRAP